jgi:RimJ/RimL family protein N-acetyltransferase
MTVGLLLMGVHNTMKISLKSLTDTDFQLVANLLSDPDDMLKVCGGAFEYPISQNRFIEYFVTVPKESGNRMCFKAEVDGLVCGMCSFTRIDWKNDYGHIGLVTVDRTKRGKGLGEMMVKSLIDQGFEKYRFYRVDLVVVEGNDSAYRFYVDRCGFIPEGQMRGMIKTGKGYLGHNVLSILRSEWFKTNGV